MSEEGLEFFDRDGMVSVYRNTDVDQSLIATIRYSRIEFVEALYIQELQEISNYTHQAEDRK